MKKEKNSQVNLKNERMFNMSTTKKPYNRNQLLKWSCFRIEKSTEFSKMYELVHTPLVELVKQPGYEQFKDRLNWLYNHYSTQGYDLVWNEIQQINEQRKVRFIQEKLIAKADYALHQQIEDWKLHFGEIPTWVDKLSDNQRALLLDRARTCYGLEPEIVVLSTKQICTVPTRVVKEYNAEGEATYYSQEELNKANFNNNYLVDVVGRVAVYSTVLKRLAENAVIRDARWMAQFNDTEFDMRELREIEGDEHHNEMVPITDMQGPDSPFGIDIEFRDFQEPIYEDESY